MRRAIMTLMVATSLAAAGAARADDAGVAAGRYEGTAFNTTAKQGGAALLEITSIRAGKVQAHFAASRGLSGDGWLSGTAAGGTLALSGPLSGWHMTLRATARPDGTLAGTYRIEGATVQEGRLQLARRGPASPVVADGEPPLTAEMAARWLDVYDGLLELHLDAAQRQQLTELLAGAWRKNDRAVIELVLEDLVNTSGEALEALQSRFGADERLAVAESSRRVAPGNVVLAAVIAAYDRAHPDRIAATRARGFSDLVGKWEWGDALAPMGTDYTGAAAGLSFSAADLLQIGGDHRFTRAKIHEQCTGSAGARCCRQYRLAWRGTADVDAGNLAFHIASGEESMQDSCRPGRVVREAVRAHVETVEWTMRPDRAHGDAPLLCWAPKGEKVVCYRRQ